MKAVWVWLGRIWGRQRRQRQREIDAQAAFWNAHRRELINAAVAALEADDAEEYERIRRQFELATHRYHQEVTIPMGWPLTHLASRTPKEEDHG